MGDRWQRIRRGARKTGDLLSRSSESVANRAGQAGTISIEAGKRALEAVVRGSSGVASRSTAGIKKRAGEDGTLIINECPVVQGMLAHRSGFQEDPPSFQFVHNLRVRPVVEAMLLTGAGAGLAAYDEVLSRLTRTVFDGDQLWGGTLGGVMEGLVGAETFASVNRFMDTVPGAAYAGGWHHRIEHGHDLSAIVDVWSEHGAEGALQAAYHIFGRDLFTPHGIPILPTGSAGVHEFLSTNLGLTSNQAADLISINFVELLAGIASVAGILRLWRVTGELRRDAAVRRLVGECQSAIERDDPIAARELSNRALAKKPADPSLLFLKGWAYHRTGNVLEAHDAYTDAVRVMSESDPGAQLGGASVSFRGIAATAALSTSAALSRDEVHQPAWLERVSSLARAGFAGFEQMADRLTDRRIIRRFGERSMLPARHLSAALNWYLAGQLAGSSLVLPDRDALMDRSIRGFQKSLDAARCYPELADRTQELDFMQELAGAELLPVRAES